MDAISQGRFRVGQVAWRKSVGDCFLTIACKLTYHLAPSVSPVAGPEEQEPIYEEDAYWNDDAKRSLSAAGDLAPFKPNADILVIGHAFAPEGEPTRVLLARLCVGEIDKSLDVWCERGFALDGSLFEGARFSKMPLTWERAAAGPSNPVGMRFDARPNAYGVVPVPNLQPPGRLISQKGDTFEPVGFGPIAPSWPGRVDKLHRYSLGFKHDRWFERPLPKDIDFAYFNAAPKDQQADSIRPNERIILEGLLPGQSRLVTNLEDVRPRVVVEFQGRVAEEPIMTADTLTIDTDRALCMVVWRGQVILRTLREAGRVVVSEVLEDAFDAHETYVSTSDAATRPVLPFSAEEVPPSRRLPEDLPDHLLAKMDLPISPAGDTLRLNESSPRTAKVLPFGPAEEALLRKKKPEDTITVIRENAKPETPFVPSRPAAVNPPDLPSEGSAGVVVSNLVPPVPVLPVLIVSAPAFVEAPPPEPGTSAAAPIQMEPSPDVSRPEESTTPAEPLPPDISLERCAELTASIARNRRDEGKILNENSMNTEQWERVKTHWNDEMRKETARGKTALLKRFDTAYVGQLEKERGPLEAEEYARISVGMERGSVEGTLLELGLPKGAVMRIERVWAARMAKDAGLEERVRAAVDVERDRE